VRTATRNAYIIFLLDGRARQSIEQAFDAGADDVISKPIVDAELRARVRLAGRVVALEEYGNRIHGEGTLLSEIAVNASLHSRQYLEIELGRELDRARRFAHPIGVLLAQAHPTNLGEHVLRSYGKFLCAHLRTRVDWVARYEERSFAVVLPETTLDGAARVAVRLQASLRKEDVTSGGLPENLQANIGVSAFDRASTVDVPSPQTLLAGAAAQLQSATRDGLGRISTAYPQRRH
jgi:diguanylate cyclase (GGDEF)-like protein